MKPLQGKAVENGQLTGERFKAMLSDYQETLLSVIDKRITNLVRNVVPVHDTHGADDDTELPGGNFAEGMIDDNQEGGGVVGRQVRLLRSIFAC